MIVIFTLVGVKGSVNDGIQAESHIWERVRGKRFDFGARGLNFSWLKVGVWLADVEVE